MNCDIVQNLIITSLEKCLQKNQIEIVREHVVKCDVCKEFSETLLEMRNAVTNKKLVYELLNDENFNISVIDEIILDCEIESSCQC